MQVKKQKVVDGLKKMFEVSSIGCIAHLIYHENLNIVEYSRHVSSFSGSYCDFCYQLPSIINRDVITSVSL